MHTFDPIFLKGLFNLQLKKLTARAIWALWAKDWTAPFKVDFLKVCSECCPDGGSSLNKVKYHQILLEQLGLCKSISWVFASTKERLQKICFIEQKSIIWRQHIFVHSFETWASNILSTCLQSKNSVYLKKIVWFTIILSIWWVVINCNGCRCWVSISSLSID